MHEALLCLKCSAMSQGLKAESGQETTCEPAKISTETGGHSDSQGHRVAERHRETGFLTMLAEVRGAFPGGSAI